MPRSPEALIEPSLLIWARKSAGFSTKDVAKKLNVKLEKVEAWESGKARPSVAQLRRLCPIYKRPLAVFFLPEPPRDFMPVRDYRRLADLSSPDEISADLRSEIRRILELRDAAISLLEDIEERKLPELPIVGRYTDNPDELAARIRKALAISSRVQSEWTDEFTALREWRNAAEGLGVLVTQASGIELDEMRGFSVADSQLPLICLNAADRANGRIFTLMHELTHVVLREGGLCEWEHPRRRSPENKQAEAFCNRVAGAVLVPEEDLLQDPTVRGTSGPRAWSDEEVRLLAQRFSVSREVILRRLLIVGRATDTFYQRRREALLKEYKLLGKRKPFPVAYEKRIANALGRSFIQLVLTSYHERRLTLDDTSSLIGVRLKHLPAIEQEVMGWSHIRMAGS